MKNLVWISLAIVLLPGCAWFKASPPQTVTVVAPVGPDTKLETEAINAHLAKTDQAVAQFGGALSKVSASAGAIKTINSGQPAGPRTDGVAGEAGLIQSIAGEPTPADALAASERARIVAEGKAADIAKAYSDANSKAVEAQKALTDTQTALKASDAALVAAKAAAATEQESLAAKLQARFTQAQKDADARVAAAVAKAQAEQQKLITWIFFGGGAALFAGGLAILLLASSVPLFGPKAGISVMGAGGGLIFIGMVMNELNKHPWILWIAISLCVAAVAGAVGLMISNQHHQASPTVIPAKIPFPVTQ